MEKTQQDRGRREMKTHNKQTKKKNRKTKIKTNTQLYTARHPFSMRGIEPRFIRFYGMPGPHNATATATMMTTTPTTPTRHEKKTMKKRQR